MLNGTASKFIGALLTGIVGWATLVVNSPAHGVTGSEWIVGATALVTAIEVYLLHNAPPSSPSP